ncbi:ABC transporter ATP-binding protein [Enterocloster bolteae]|uniref:ABC transporter ATP-binding protein n=1 Tax=Enterocloster bolteae TaxID=208479 RepID=UPI002A834DF0|nr:ABC transporter ATP-binding protein [Enterocloster bolteae]
MNMVELQHISKSFGAVKALTDASIQLAGGQTHVLLGENGAGKTTLMRILYGMMRPDSGKILINNNEVHFKHNRDAIACGIGMVHQHFMLVENMTVYENVAVGFEDETGLTLDKCKIISKINELAQKLKFDIDPLAMVCDLTVGEKQRIEILKTIYRQSKIIILDEPTAVLTPQEVDVLFEIIDILKAQGTSIVMITHKLKECLKIADRISVMRDGRMISTNMENRDLTQQLLADLMVGRNIPLNYTQCSEIISGEIAVKVENLNYTVNGKKVLDNVNFNILKGEILGVAGIEGNGQRELQEALSGNLKPDTMDLYLYDKKVSGDTRAMIDKGIALVPEDRLSTGLVPSLSICDNVVLGYHRTGIFATKLGFLRLKQWKQFAKEAIEKFAIKAPSFHAPIGSLSGGNQQKVIIARVLSRDPRFAIFAQPTRGVDIGAIHNIHSRIFEYRDKGNAALVISADLDEVRALSDHLIVMYEGKIVADGKSNDFTELELGMLMLTGKLEKEGSKS